jgi:RNA-directed DNA polymerase
MDRSILKKWLEAGYIEDATFHPTHRGTPQGGIISPVIANLVLDGLERVAKEAAPPNSKVHTIRYADDFIITGCSREILEMKIVPAVQHFLAERGLRLSTRKSKITRIENGFDFLGANVRKYNGKLLMKPSKDGLHGFLRNLREFIRTRGGLSTVLMIRALNRKIQGWTSQNRNLVSSRAFQKIDYELFGCLWKWAKKRHRNKGSRWIKVKYFRSKGLRNWIFSARLPRKDPQRSLFPESSEEYLDLVSASQVPIRRHIKVRANARLYDPEHADYFRRRRVRQRQDRLQETDPFALE